MNIKDLREWLSELPTDFDDCEIVYRKLFPMKTLNTPDTMMAKDTPIVGATIDINTTREACFYNKKSMKIVDNNETNEPIEKL
jgi:hypothetical protein